MKLSKTIVCKICNKEMSVNNTGPHLKKYHDLSIEEYYLKYVGEKHYCLTCGKETSFKTLEKGYSKYCTTSCSNKSSASKSKSKKTKLDRYGDENYNNKNKYIETCLEKYGVVNAYQVKEIREKHQDNMKQKYGVKHPTQINFVKDKIREKWYSKTKEEKEQINIKRKEIMQLKYGVDHQMNLEYVKNKIKETNLKLYGDKNYNNREKAKETNLKKYGVEYPAQSSEIFNKVKKTNLERYGVEYTTLSKDFKFKSEQTNINRYGNKCANSSDIIKSRIYKNRYDRFFIDDRLKGKIIPAFYEAYKGVKFKYKWKCTVCGNEFYDHLLNGRVPRCCICYPKLAGTSHYETEISEWLTSLNISYTQNNRTLIYPLELDFYIPQHNLAIEFDGLYWHSEARGKKQYYHLNKTKACNNKNINLIHIFEDEWLTKSNIVKSIILSKLNIFDKTISSNDCVFNNVSCEEATIFLNDNHIQGKSYSNNNIGLYYKDELVSMISLGKPKHSSYYNCEILRFCNKLNNNVINSLSKLINHISDKKIIFYVDKRYSTEQDYFSSGFKKIGESKPKCYQVKDFERESKQNRDKLLVEQDERDRIWDCGNYTFSL